MGWGTGNLGVGGGASLNFKIVSYATEEALLASTPAENTIGVITEHEIASWTFSPSEPTEPVEGMLWIVTGTGSAVEFNALKKNAIQVYPISAKQYFSDAWADVTAKTYQGGTWVEWFLGTYLYKEGDECTDITGGLVRGTHGNSYWGSYSVTKNEDHILCSGAYGGSYFSLLRTSRLIDLSNVNTVNMRVSSFTTNGSNTKGRIHVSKATNLGDNPPATKLFYPPTTGVISLDVSSLNGSYYIYFGASFEVNNSGDLKITEVWIE